MDLVFTALYFLSATGVAWPIVARLPLSTLEKCVALPVFSLVGVFLFGWIGFLSGWSPLVYWCIPLLSLLGAIWHRQMLRALLQDPVVTSLLTAQLLVIAWNVSWLALVLTYTGGGWAGDWLEHWQRTLFFVRHDPLETVFLDTYPLTARPPLTNVITAVVLGTTRADFGGYQLVSTLFASLAFLPAASLAWRFAGLEIRSQVAAVLAVFFMVNPCFVQNATFAWTKLPTAFFVLAGLGFWLRAVDRDGPRISLCLCAVSLAAGVLSHYSAAVYAVVLAVAWLARNRFAWGQRPFWRVTSSAALVAAALLAVWFSWAIWKYGLLSTVSSNTSITELDARPAQQVWKIGMNVRDTLVPHFFRAVDTRLIAQRSPWGYAGDWLFQLYQANAWFVCGCAGLAAVCHAALQRRRSAPKGAPRFWLLFVGATFVGGIAVHGSRAAWGVAHICLQPLVLLALSFLAASWSMLTRFWKIVFVVGSIVDLLAGIILHFGLQTLAIERWASAANVDARWFGAYSINFIVNLRAKTYLGLEFFGDRFEAASALVLALLGAILTLALTRACRRATTRF